MESMRESKHPEGEAKHREHMLVVSEMLQQRGYSRKDNIVFSKEGVSDILVVENQSDKLNVADVPMIIKKVHQVFVSKGHILVIYKDITPSAKKALHAISEAAPLESKDLPLSVRVELFQYSELRFNITKHNLQPLFVLLGEIEQTEIRKIFKGKMPVMLSTDPVARFFGLHSKEVLKIVDKKCGSVRYRIVV